MQALYRKMVLQIKSQQIQNYNLKHAQYLRRSGKLNYQIQNALRHQNADVIQSKKSRRKRSFNQNQLQILHSNQIKDKHLQQTGSDYRPVVSNNFQANYHDNFNKQTILSTQKAQFQTVQEKQRSLKPLAVQNTQEFPAENQNVQLFECPEGCGRKFASKQLEKHAKNCKKVFQQKRKPFQVKKTDQQAQLAKKDPPKIEDKKKPNQKPKWKKQSQKWRKMFANNSNANNQVEQQEFDDRIPCPSCGRKFNQKAAERHISSCLNRKQRK